MGAGRRSDPSRDRGAQWGILPEMFHVEREVGMEEPMLQFFEYEHLPERLQAVSRPFGELATGLVATLPRNPERTVALRKLLEAKDCAVRAVLYKSAS